MIAKDTDQRRCPDHVVGVNLGFGGDWNMVSFDATTEAHAKRVAQLAAHGLDARARYWVLSDYD